MSFWGEKAIQLAKELDDEEILCHALNNVGVSQFQIHSSTERGRASLMESLNIALKYSLHEHAARAYTNLGASAVAMKDYVFAKEMLDKGIQFCEGREMDSWSTLCLHGKPACSSRLANGMKPKSLQKIF